MVKTIVRRKMVLHQKNLPSFPRSIDPPKGLRRLRKEAASQNGSRLIRSFCCAKDVLCSSETNAVLGEKLIWVKNKNDEKKLEKKVNCPHTEKLLAGD